MPDSSTSAGSPGIGTGTALAGARARPKVPLARPLGHARYRRLWLANLVSNLGTWIQAFASAWLVASLSQSAAITSLVQTATYLPVFVRDVLRMQSSTYGTLMGCLGGGAVMAAFFLPQVRARVDKTGVLAGALLVYGAMLATMSFSRSLYLLVPLVLCGGMAWSAAVSTLNAAAQLSFPAEVRARTLSIYLFVMCGGYAGGSIFWGQVAELWGVPAALAAAGACVLANALILLAGNRRMPL